MVKYLVLIGCLLAAGGKCAFAQQVASQQEAAVTNAGFVHKVADFDKAVTRGELAEGEALFAAVNKMATTEFANSRDKMRNATTDADKVRYRDLTLSQRKLFAEALKLKQQDMVANRAVIVEKLRQFAATIQ